MIFKKIQQILFETTFMDYFDPFEGFIQKPFFIPFLRANYLANEIEFPDDETKRKILIYSYYIKFLKEEIK